MRLSVTRDGAATALVGLLHPLPVLITVLAGGLFAFVASGWVPSLFLLSLALTHPR